MSLSSASTLYSSLGSKMMMQQSLGLVKFIQWSISGTPEPCIITLKVSEYDC